MQARLTKTFHEALRDPQKPLTTHYGALLGLRFFGPHTVHMLLMPMMPAYLQQLNALMQPADAAPAASAPAPIAPPARDSATAPLQPASSRASRRASAIRQADALRVYHVALSTCGTYLFRHGHLFGPAPLAGEVAAAASFASFAPPAAAGAASGAVLLPRLAASYEALAAEFGPALLAHSRPAETSFEAHTLRSLHGVFL